MSNGTMRLYGLAAGMGPESSLEYERLIHEGVRENLGGLSCGRLISYAENYEDIKQFICNNDTAGLTEAVWGIVDTLESAGCDRIAIGTNTVHIVAPEIEERLETAKLDHITAPIAECVSQNNIGCVALLGTRMTMEEDFWPKALEERLPKGHKTKVITPRTDSELKHVNDFIFEGLMKQKEIPLEETLERFIPKITEIICKLQSRGAEAVVLGCTELPQGIKEENSCIQILDSTELHARYIVKQML